MLEKMQSIRIIRQSNFIIQIHFILSVFNFLMKIKK